MIEEPYSVRNVGDRFDEIRKSLEEGRVVDNEEPLIQLANQKERKKKKPQAQDEKDLVDKLPRFTTEDVEKMDRRYPGTFN